MAILIGALSLLSTVGLYGAILPEVRSGDLDSLVFYFANNSSLLMRDYRTNETELNKLDSILQTSATLSALDSIVIEGCASVIGSFRTNSQLSYQRALAVKGYIRWKHPHVDSKKIYIAPAVFNWNELRKLVQQDLTVPCREDILQILSSPLSDGSMLAEIKRLGGGAAENYIINNFSKYMRSATSLVFYVKQESVERSLVRVEERREEVPSQKKDSFKSGFAGDQTIPPTVRNLDETPKESTITSDLSSWLGTSTRKPLFALKSNLLYDLGTALNVAVEIPIGQRWSMAVEWIFPWWLWEKKQYALEIMNGNLETRYWWGDRAGCEQMTGWFTGLYGGGGIYDVEWKTKGYQGEFFTGGFTGGFAHKIGRDLRMEYSLGIGYIGSRYREYVPNKCVDGDWHLISQKSGNFNWVGPTQAKVSLVWMIGHNSKKGNK